jgi:hypothetical protein
MASLPTPVSTHRSSAARRDRRCSNASTTVLTEFTDMDPEGFSLSDLAFEMDNECASKDAAFHKDGDDFPSCRPAPDSPPPLPTPLLAAFVSEKLAPAPAGPRASFNSPVSVTYDAWIYGAGGTPGMHC